MKASRVFAAVVIVSLASCYAAFSQYKAPSQYFRKDSPGRPGAPGGPGAPATPAKPAVPQQPKFKDLSVNAQFYFLADTNRQFAWTKISAESAKNQKNGVTQVINGETPVQR